MLVLNSDLRLFPSSEIRFAVSVRFLSRSEQEHQPRWVDAPQIFLANSMNRFAERRRARS